MRITLLQRLSALKVVNNGFTLVEVLATIAIMGLLISIIIGTMNLASKKADESKARAQIARMELGLEKYKTQWGVYPKISAWTNLSSSVALQGNKDLIALLFRAPGQIGTSQEVYLELKDQEMSGDGAFLDPWGNLYYFEGKVPSHNPDSYDLMSKGPDPYDPSDDITNWK